MEKLEWLSRLLDIYIKTLKGEKIDGDKLPEDILSGLLCYFQDLFDRGVEEEIVLTRSTIILRGILEKLNILIALIEEQDNLLLSVTNPRDWERSFFEMITTQYIPDLALLVDSNKRYIPGYRDNEEYKRLIKNDKQKQEEFDKQCFKFKEIIDYELYLLLNSINGYLKSGDRIKKTSCEPITFRGAANTLDGLRKLVSRRLEELSFPEGYFQKTMVLDAAIEVFEKLDLIKNLDIEKVKWELNYMQDLTFKINSGNKRYLIRIIYLLSEFVKQEYKEDWEQRLISHLELKSYDKEKNKFYEGEKMALINDTFERYKQFLEHK